MSGGNVFHSNSRSEKKFTSQKPILVSHKPLKPVTQSSSSTGHVLTKKQIIEHKTSIFDRLGSSGSDAGSLSGTKITISNLNKTVSSSDVVELCGSIGEIKQVEMKTNSFGVSLVWIGLPRSPLSPSLPLSVSFSVSHCLFMWPGCNPLCVSVCLCCSHFSLSLIWISVSLSVVV